MENRGLSFAVNLHLVPCLFLSPNCLSLLALVRVYYDAEEHGSVKSRSSVSRWLRTALKPRSSKCGKEPEFVRLKVVLREMDTTSTTRCRAVTWMSMHDCDRRRLPQ